MNDDIKCKYPNVCIPDCRDCGQYIPKTEQCKYCKHEICEHDCDNCPQKTDGCDCYDCQAFCQECSGFCGEFNCSDIKEIV